jgi:NAD-dependent SIR2 family protein deacetylase
MLIDDIISGFDANGTRSHYQFETFTLNLLKYHIENQDKHFALADDRSRRGIGDAVSDTGFDNFKGKTVIEIKSSLGRLPTKMIVEQLVYRLSRKDELNNFEHLLIINIRPVPLGISERIISEFKAVNPSINVVIWGPEEINKIVVKHKKQAAAIVNNLFSLRLETAVSKTAGDWEKEREERLKELSDSYERGQFAFFLGAGVSSSAGMPDWNTLLNSLFVSYVAKEFIDQAAITENDIKQIVERLNNVDEPSALMAARYLRKGFSKDRTELNEFIKIITENLYKLRDATKKIHSDLLVSISGLCMPKRTGANVKSVVTYNFDDLLEKILSSKTIQHHSIYSENEYYHPNELPVYHVHGFLPENTKGYESLDKSTLVFSEEGYHQIYSEPYHWSNLVQLNNLREYNCIMVGLSMTDPNLRRLLDISARNLDKPRHFAFLQRMTKEKFVYTIDPKTGEKKQAINNVKSAEEFLDKHHKLNEEIMKELGVSVIWFTDFPEIPVLLDRLATNP